LIQKRKEDQNGVALLFLLWATEALWCLSDMLLKPRMLSYAKGFQREVDCHKFDLATYQNMVKRSFHIRSDYGYLLSCELVNSPNDTGKKIAILCHGLGYARYGSIKYMDLFLKLGFSVLMYDHRNHGESGKAFTTMGFYEKYDLKRVVDWCYQRYGPDCHIITHGESMGASTVLLHLGIDNRIKCAIADCPYSDLKQLLRHQLKQYYHLPKCLIPVENKLNYLRAGFRYQQVSPIRVVSHTEIPVLFIHGKWDSFVPSSMSRQMYLLKPCNKGLYLVAKARHADSYCRNKEGYDKRVAEFLNKYMKE
jgi:fermentation-respiration switch protein FrsA (DUF1100 family)